MQWFTLGMANPDRYCVEIHRGVTFPSELRYLHLAHSIPETNILLKFTPQFLRGGLVTNVEGHTLVWAPQGSFQGNESFSEELWVVPEDAAADAALTPPKQRSRDLGEDRWALVAFDGLPAGGDNHGWLHGWLDLDYQDRVRWLVEYNVCYRVPRSLWLVRENHEISCNQPGAWSFTLKFTGEGIVFWGNDEEGDQLPVEYV